MTVATLPIFVPRSVPAADTPEGPVSPKPSGADLPPANVVEWHQVADLPWRGAFDMVPLPAMVPPVERRRRVDGRSLADVVKAVAA